uniref:Uncharacterized protein n=1 Tax=Arundo donax TaxID=35708 RepID=A0A0A9AJK3_ARUDO
MEMVTQQVQTLRVAMIAFERCSLMRA